MFLQCPKPLLSCNLSISLKTVFLILQIQYTVLFDARANKDCSVGSFQS